MMSLRASFTPDEDTTFGLPAPAPLSVNLLAFALIHFFHASIILVSSGLRSCSGFFIHSSMTALGALYRTRNLSIVASMPWLYGTPELLLSPRQAKPQRCRRCRQGRVSQPL